MAVVSLGIGSVDDAGSAGGWSPTWSSAARYASSSPGTLGEVLERHCESGRIKIGSFRFFDHRDIVKALQRFGGTPRAWGGKEGKREVFTSRNPSNTPPGSADVTGLHF